MRLITLLTDFGLRDYYVAAMKGVILSRTPSATLVDISHQIAAGDIAEASFVLEAAAPCFPAGTIHLAVVDPGVGSGREILLVEQTDGTLLVAPDNGLLHAFFDDARRVVAVDREDLYRQAPGVTFHGRDRFAPIVAALAAGLEPSDAGPPIEEPRRQERARPKKGHGFIEGQVIHIDHFGNVVTDIPASWLPPSERVEIKATVGDCMVKKVVSCYAEIQSGEDALVLGSLGFWELSRNGESMAAAWRVHRGQRVEVRFSSTVKEDSKSEPHRAASKRGQNETVGVQDHQYPE